MALTMGGDARERLESLGEGKEKKIITGGKGEVVREK